MGNSTYTLQDIVDDALAFGELAPVLATGGYSNQPAVSIANDVMSALLLGGPNGEPFNWKWNRFNVPLFTTNSYQTDYFVPGLVNLAWLENAWASNINQTSIPKEVQQLEVHRDLLVTSQQTGYPEKLCWIPVRTANVGVWGQHPLGPTAGFPSGETGLLTSGQTGQQNPGPSVIYSNNVGVPSQPMNATTIIKDSNGNFWVLTTYGTCGSTQPSWPSTPTYPTPTNPSAVATTVTDGSVVWTAINPDGQAMRLNPIPSQTGTVWQIQAVGQYRVKKFTQLTDSLDPVPDDYITYFKQGFAAQCYRRSPDPKVRAKFEQEWSLFLASLDKGIKQGQREMDDMGFYPSQSIMDSGVGNIWIGPGYPWPPFGA